VLRNQNGRSTKRHHSFVSKFAHFFIDPERFPIMDSYPVSLLKVHLGANTFRIRNALHRISGEPKDVKEISRTGGDESRIGSVSLDCWGVSRLSKTL